MLIKIKAIEKHGLENISDKLAIEWALGRKRILKKVMGLAWVELTIANTNNELPIECSEVVIVRRSYSSMASEFFINHVACHLSDIKGLMKDKKIEYFAK